MSTDWYTPQVLAKKLSIFTGRKFSEAEMLPYAHAMIDLPEDDLRREKLGLALWGVHEAWENGDLRLMALMSWSSGPVYSS